MPKRKKANYLFKNKTKYLVVFAVILVAVILGFYSDEKISIDTEKPEKKPEGIVSFVAKQEIFYASLISELKDLLPTPFATESYTVESNQTVDLSQENQSSLSYEFLIIGDSFMAEKGAVGEPLEEDLSKLKGVSVKRFGKIGSGLIDTGFFDWYKKSENLFINYEPDFVVILMGNNDARSFKSVDENGRNFFYEVGTLEWEKAYRQKVRDFLKTFDKEGVKVYWIGLSAMRDKNFSDQIKKINFICEEEIKNFKNAQFIPVWNLISDGKGNYVEFLKDENGLYRKTHLEDGIHLTYFSGGIIAEEFIKELKKNNYFLFDWSD